MLVGVRISAFVSSDDKKPLQKSIVGFLQPDKTDLSRASQGMHQKLEKEHLSNHSLQTLTLASLPLAQTCQREEVTSWRKQRGLEGSKTGGEPQQSFFQRAHAKRMQLQVANASTQEEKHGENTSVVTPTCTQKGLDASTEVHESICTASDASENDFVAPVEAHASTSGFGSTVSESFTCPVCFRLVETTDLTVFNKHIDQCLSDASRKPNQIAVSQSDSESDLDLENNHTECEVAGRRRGESEVEEEGAKNSEKMDSSRAEPQEDQCSLKNRSMQMDVSIDCDNVTVTSQRPQSCNDKGPVLICPICQVTQDNDDLVIFNRHVDLCLNQEVLHELGGQASCPINPPAVPNFKALGKDVYPVWPRNTSSTSSSHRNPILCTSLGFIIKFEKTHF